MIDGLHYLTDLRPTKVDSLILKDTGILDTETGEALYVEYKNKDFSIYFKDVSKAIQTKRPTLAIQTTLNFAQRLTERANERDFLAKQKKTHNTNTLVRTSLQSIHRQERLHAVQEANNAVSKSPYDKVPKRYISAPKDYTKKKSLNRYELSDAISILVERGYCSEAKNERVTRLEYSVDIPCDDAIAFTKQAKMYKNKALVPYSDGLSGVYADFKEYRYKMYVPLPGVLRIEIKSKTFNNHCKTFSTIADLLKVQTLQDIKHILVESVKHIVFKADTTGESKAKRRQFRKALQTLKYSGTFDTITKRNSHRLAKMRARDLLRRYSTKHYFLARSVRYAYDELLYAQRPLPGGYYFLEALRPGGTTGGRLFKALVLRVYTKETISIAKAGCKEALESVKAIQEEVAMSHYSSIIPP